MPVLLNGIEDRRPTYNSWIVLSLPEQEEAVASVNPFGVTNAPTPDNFRACPDPIHFSR
jgi:hypothetical protein